MISKLFVNIKIFAQCTDHLMAMKIAEGFRPLKLPATLLVMNSGLQSLTSISAISCSVAVLNLYPKPMISSNRCGSFGTLRSMLSYRSRSLRYVQFHITSGIAQQLLHFTPCLHPLVQRSNRWLGLDAPDPAPKSCRTKREAHLRAG
jgi:hypothetical protein